MKNSGFPQRSYEEQIARRNELAQRKKDRPKSAAAVAGKKRSNKSKAEHDAQETAWKLAVRIKDDWACQYEGCTKRYDSIDCHHVAERSQRKDLIYVVSNGKCLCVEHHRWVHDHPQQAVEKGLLSYRSRELADREGTLDVY